VGVGQNLEKYFIGLFHISGHLGHFKAMFAVKDLQEIVI
jgi:hypothetical protein